MTLSTACSYRLILFDEFADWAIAHKLTLDDESSLPTAAGGGATAAAPPAPRSFGAAGGGPKPPPVVVQQPSAPRPVSAYAGNHLKSPRPTSARAAPGSVGWRGGGSTDRAKSSQVDAAELEQRREALEAVAIAAADGFARAPLVPPKAPTPKETEALRRQRALGALKQVAQHKVQSALSYDDKLERVWSQHKQKISPATTQVSSPPPRHVPSERDGRMGCPSDKALAAKALGQQPPPGSDDPNRVQFGGGRLHVRAARPTRTPPPHNRDDSIVVRAHARANLGMVGRLGHVLPNLRARDALAGGLARFARQGHAHVALPALPDDAAADVDLVRRVCAAARAARLGQREAACQAGRLDNVGWGRIHVARPRAERAAAPRERGREAAHAAQVRALRA